MALRQLILGFFAKDVDSRKQIYAPTYAKAVESTEAFQRLKKLYETEKEIIIWGTQKFCLSVSALLSCLTLINLRF
jgi:hypothetical protein